MKALTSKWKSVVGLSLVFISLSVWVYMGLKLFVYRPLPESFTDERKEAQLRRMIDLRVNPVTGLTSKWGYEQDKWK